MTFIASVVAKDGIAIIADSLVSSMIRTLDQRGWNKFLQKKREQVKEGEDFKFSEEDITELFESRPSHTKDYENKLFEYDSHTAITTAGSAIINGKRISTLVAEIKKKLQKKKQSYRRQGIEKKVTEFCALLEAEIKLHIEKEGYVDNTTFIFSHFDKNASKSVIYKVSVTPSNTKSLEDPEHIVVKQEVHKQLIICDGQPGIAYRILYGGLFDALRTHSMVIESCKEELAKAGIKEGEQLPANFFEELSKTQEETIISTQIKEAQLFQLSSTTNRLSLQQAADLAYLLLKLERDFQAYTKEIPTVGGHVKLATINEDGINFILGKTIIKPTRHI